MRALTIVASLAACSEKPQGILLVITTDEDTPFDTLEVGIGPEMSGISFLDNDRNGDDDDDTRDRLHVHDVLGDGAFSTQSRNLHSEPFRYFIRGENSDKLNIGIVGRSEGAVIGIAALEAVRIEPGVVREYEVVLSMPTTLSGETGEHCVRAFDPDRVRQLILTYGTDFDCDGYQIEDNDCDPFDALVNPGVAFDDCQDGPNGARDNNCNGFCNEDAPSMGGVSECGTLVNSPTCELECNAPNAPQTSRIGEVCDGLDSDCRPDTLPHATRTLCAVGNLQEGCSIGSKSCNDNGPGPGPFGECQPLDNSEASRDLCAARDTCIQPSPQTEFECMAQESGAKQVHCVLPYSENDGLCDSRVALEIRGGDDCELDILDPRLGGDDPPPRIVPLLDEGNTARCDKGALSFVLVDETGPVASFEFIMRKSEQDNIAGMVHVIADVQLVESCGETTPQPLCNLDILSF